MRNGELSKMSLKELRALRDQVDAAISARETRERDDVKRRIAEMASKSGFNVGELFDSGRGHKWATIKYRHKDDPSLTWTGRGRRPLWIAKAGGDIERFRVR